MMETDDKRKGNTLKFLFVSLFDVDLEESCLLLHDVGLEVISNSFGEFLRILGVPARHLQGRGQMNTN